MYRPIFALTLITGLALLTLGSAPASAQDTVLDQVCLAALDTCSLSCTELGDPASTAACQTRCEKAANACLGDERPTLSSEEYLAYWGDNSLATKASACHDTTPCPPEYGSCASWSNFSDCGDPSCGFSTACKVCNEWGQCTVAGPETTQQRERYRVCFNAQMEACTEYQRFTQSLGCGC